jgi:hypothetical protein
LPRDPRPRTSRIPLIFHPTCCSQKRINKSPRYFHIKCRSGLLRSFLLRSDSQCFANHYCPRPFVPLLRRKTGLSSPPFIFS